MSVPALLLLLLAGLPRTVGWVWAARRRHAALIAVVAASFLFALSNRISLGQPSAARGAAAGFGAAAASACFAPVATSSGCRPMRSWPAASSWRLGRKPSWPTTALCLAAPTMADRRRRAAACRCRGRGLRPVPAVLDRDRVAALATRSRAIEAFPSFGCVYDAIVAGNDPTTNWDRLSAGQYGASVDRGARQSADQFADNSRPPTDCRAEDAQRRATLRPGTLCLYLMRRPDGAQLDGRTQAMSVGR